MGGTVTVASYTPEQIAATLGGTADVGAPAGPRIHLHVVGIERRVSDLGESAVSGGLLVFTPAFDRTYAGRVGVFGSYVRIGARGGPEHAAPVVATARRIFGETLFSSRIASETGGAESAIDVLTLALWIFVGVVALAGTLTVAIVLGREVTLLTREHDMLLSLGATRVERLAVCVPSALLVAAGGGLLAVLGAVTASPLFPLGVARRADPDVGVHVDVGVLAVGIAAVFLVTLAITFTAAWRATRPAARLRSVDRRPSRATVVERVAEVGFRPPVANGVRLALDRGRGRIRVPVRSAIAGAVVGVLGVTAVFLFAVNVDQLVHSPSRYGWTWDFETRDTTSNTPCGAGTYGLRHTEGVSAVAEVCYQGVQVDGRPIEGLAFRDLRGTTIGPVVLAGRAPVGRHDVVLGRNTLRALGKEVGDTVRVSGRRTRLRYRVVGEAVFPTLGQAQPLADGAAFTGAGFAPLFDRNVFSRYFVGRVAPGTDPVALAHRISRVRQLSAPSGAILPVEVDRLRQISWLPVALATLFGVVGLVAIGHALVTTVRRRRGELVVLKALGFDRGQVRATVAWQAITMVIAGLALGIPLGTVTGAIAWRIVADGLGIAPETAIPVLGIALIIPIAVLFGVLAAYLPARAAARTRPAVTLRSG